jgi:hypothetical protein
MDCFFEISALRRIASNYQGFNCFDNQDCCRNIQQSAKVNYTFPLIEKTEKRVIEDNGAVSFLQSVCAPEGVLTVGCVFLPLDFVDSS